MILQGNSAGRIELDIAFENTKDKDGEFVRCLIYTVPTYQCITGPWMRTRELAFQHCMLLIIKEKNLLNITRSIHTRTVH